MPETNELWFRVTGTSHNLSARTHLNQDYRPAQKHGKPLRIKYWEIIADRLSAAGYSWGYSGALTREGWRYIVDARCRDGRRFIVQSDELLTAFLELEAMFL